METANAALGPRKAKEAERRALRKLVTAGLAEVRDVKAPHRDASAGWENYYYLSPRRNLDAAVTASHYSGKELDDKEAREKYKLFGGPGQASHVVFRTDYLIRLIDDARAVNLHAGREVVRFPLEKMWGESYPGFPLIGARQDTDPAGEKLPDKGGFRRYERVKPDGRVVGEWPERDVECSFDLEIERWSRTQTLDGQGAIPKIEMRAGWMARIYEQRLVEETKALLRARRRVADAGGYDADLDSYSAVYPKGPPPGWWVGLGEADVPLLFLYPTHRRARGMRDRVAEALTAGSMPRFAALAKKAEASGVDLGRIVLFGGWDAVSREPRASVGSSYLALAGLGQGDEKVPAKLYDAAEAALKLRAPQRRPAWRERVATKGFDR